MNDDDITIIEDDDLEHLFDIVNGISARTEIYKLRIYRNSESGTVKIKFNESTWTGELGRKGND